MVEVAKADLGTKRLCPNCGAKYYDLGRAPIICPRCGTTFEVPTTKARAAPPPPVVVEPEEVVVEAEIISLEEADAEAAGGVEEEAEEGEEVEVAADAEDVFLEPEEGEEDVSGIIGGVDEDET